MTGMAKLGWHGTRVRPGGKFQARWQDQEGLQSEGGFISKTQAETYALRMANEALNVKVGLAVLRKDLQDARSLFLDRRTKPNTRALNQRRIDEFFTAMPELKTSDQLTNHVINRYALLLEEDGHNPGGQNHHLRIVRIFTNFCLANKWLTIDPFENFVMPKSTYEGRALTADERALMYTVNPRFKDVDTQLTLAFRFGYSTMLRISQVWTLTPADFREPNMLRISGIKGQKTVTILLEDEAVQILKGMPIRAQHERFFSHWSTVEAMRNSVEDKARRAGLPGIRFHDVCKVSKISDLDAAGVGLGDLAHLSNTSQMTLAKHYIKSDRDRAFSNYINRGKNPGHTVATTWPQNDGLEGSIRAQPALEGTSGTVENASTSQ